MDRLKKEDGSIVESQEELETTLSSFFSKLLQEPERDREEVQREVLSHIPKIITEDHNQILKKAIEMVEVENAVKQMAKDKAPWPRWFHHKLLPHWLGLDERRNFGLSGGLKEIWECSQSSQLNFLNSHSKRKWNRGP